MRRSISSRRAVAVLALSLTLVAFPLGVLASHQYSDVATSNPFHADIAAITNAGVTSGCGGGQYCPDRNVTRAEMAAFMNRLGALAAGKTPVVNADRLDGLNSSQLARTDELRHYSCDALGMTSDNSSVVFGGNAGNRYLISGPGFLTCPVHLPDGATVSGFVAKVNDTTSGGEVSCGLQAVGAEVTWLPLAVTGSTGVAPTPGYATLFDIVIDNAVVDNLVYSYNAWCYFTAASTSLSVQQVIIGYIGPA